MPRICTVCTHPDRDAIDRALVAGEPVAKLSALFRVSADSLDRHKRAHLPQRLAQATQAATVAKADDLLAEVRALRAKAVAILLKAEAAGDYRTALAGIREARACLEVLLDVEGELDRRPTVNVLVLPEWLALRTTILAALDPFPEAKVALSAALVSGTNGHAG